MHHLLSLYLITVLFFFFLDLNPHCTTHSGWHYSQHWTEMSLLPTSFQMFFALYTSKVFGVFFFFKCHEEFS